MKPSPEQLAQIRRFSCVVYGDPDAVFDHHPEPESREEASDLLKTLNETPVQRREPMETKVCNRCDIEKPLSAYAKNKRLSKGRENRCRDCQSEVRAGQPSTKAAPDQTDRVSRTVEFQSTNGIGETNGHPIFPESEGHHFALASDGQPDEHRCLSELRNPRLSTLRGIQDAVAETLADAGTITLDEAAALAGQIADLDLS